MYRVLQPVLHGVREGDAVVERRFEVGDWADFPAKDAKELLAIGAIEQVPERPTDRGSESNAVDVAVQQFENASASADALKTDELKGDEVKPKATATDAKETAK